MSAPPTTTVCVCGAETPHTTPIPSVDGCLSHVCDACAAPWLLEWVALRATKQRDAADVVKSTGLGSPLGYQCEAARWEAVGRLMRGSGD